MTRNYTYAQHFLRSPRLAAELVGHTNIRKNDVVYDLGAGSGVISSVLAGRCKHVVAVETEPGALKNLRKNLQELDNVTIVEQSILDLVLPGTPYKICSNIPFSISAEVVRKFTSQPSGLRAMFLIVQKQFARKLVPGDDHFTSQLSAEIGPFFDVRIRKPLRKTDFTPPPAVDTVLLEIKPRSEPMIDSNNMNAYHDFTTRCFARQKYFQSLDRQKEKNSVSVQKNPSQLSTTEWVRLFSAMLEKS